VAQLHQEAGMKDTQLRKLSIDAKIALRSIIRLLVQSLELLNKISEEEYRLLIPRVRNQKQNVKGVLDNIARGNLFMTLFFVREILEKLLSSEE
jgi:hypothetical protein